MAKMRAMAVHEAGGKLQAEERDIPVPKRDEMRIRVEACGVCHSDVLTVHGLMPGIQYPRIPGHEVIGVVDALGEGVSGWSVGARAGVGWFGGACGYCSRCRRDAAFACENVHEVTGVTRDGGYATHLIAHVSSVAHVPEDLDAVESAPCSAPASRPSTRSATAARDRATSSPSTASAGSGISAFSTRRSRAFGPSRSIEAATRRSSPASSGRSDYIDSAAEDPAKALQAMGGAKAILATVTNGEAMQAIAGGLGPNGVMMVIGAVGPLTVNSLDLIQKSAAVKGWYSGIAGDSEDTLEFSRRNMVASMNEVYPLERAQDAYERMLSGKARFRVVLRMEV